MSKGAYAKGTLPGAKELGVEILTLRSEIERLRAALELITTVVEDSPVKTYQRMEQIANQALSSSPDTGEQKDQ